MKKWEILGYLFAVLNPVLPGILIGWALYTEKKYKKTGVKVIALSIIMLIVYTALAIYVAK